MAKHRTLEEKEKLIKEFRNSGLSMKSWCKASGISPSTISGWIYPKKGRNKIISDVRFVEVPAVRATSVPMITAEKSIIIKCNSIEIEATSSTDLTLLGNILKVVKSVDV